MQGPHASPPSGRIAQTHPHPHKQTHAATKRFGGTDELRKEACRCALRRATRVTSTSPRHSRPGKNHGWADVYTCGGERFSSLPLFPPLDHNRDSLLLPLARQMFSRVGIHTVKAATAVAARRGLAAVAARRAPNYVTLAAGMSPGGPKSGANIPCPPIFVARSFLVRRRMPTPPWHRGSDIIA